MKKFIKPSSKRAPAFHSGIEGSETIQASLMEVKRIHQDLSVHNRYDIEVRDAKTGTLKQEAVAYNVICNGYFTLLLDGDAHNLFQYIGFGSGSGTPAITDTALFTLIDKLQTSNYQTVYGNPTSHRTVQVILDADSYNGSTITEVGLFGENATYVGKPQSLVSHALIQDSEGQPIAITKTNTDVIYIRATFYVTFTAGGFGDNGVYPAPSSNILVKFALGLALTKSQENTVYFSAYNANMSYSSELNSVYSYQKSLEYDVTGSASTRTLTISASILTEEGGQQAIRCVGFPGIGAFNFPDSSVMEYYRVSGKAIGTGDGETTDFNLGVPCLKSGSAHIYVDDVEQTEGTDYTLDCNANDTDSFSEYASARLSLIDMPEKVKWGDARSRASVTALKLDPLHLVHGGHYVLNELPRYCYITAANPIWMDFTTAKECNTLKIYGTLPSGKLDSLAIEYSNDNESWTAVAYTRTDQIYKWSLVSGRYWRIYIPNYSWQFDLTENNTATRDGSISSYACYFLGKTKPALHFLTAPAQDAVITATFDLDVPYKTENNIIRITVVATLNRD